MFNGDTLFSSLQLSQTLCPSGRRSQTTLLKAGDPSPDRSWPVNPSRRDRQHLDLPPLADPSMALHQGVPLPGGPVLQARCTLNTSQKGGIMSHNNAQSSPISRHWMTNSTDG
ncbi:hypothetical protein KEM48_012765 [Puccinia striiformis f. sp. tritici PST-130]|nr:hypothetical protein KEM48_012765 [Puccinia striiformis f. sp. tritici PST-130]